MLRTIFAVTLALAVGACDDGGGGGGGGGGAPGGSGGSPGGAGGGGSGGGGGPGGAGGGGQGGAGGSPCVPGTDGCPCGPMAPCPGDEVCEAGQCVEMPMRGLAVSDPNARSCELYLQESGESRVTGATFGAGVRGRWLRQAPAVAVVFVREADEGFPEGSIGLQIAGPANGVALRTATCADRLGRDLPGVEVTLR